MRAGVAASPAAGAALAADGGRRGRLALWIAILAVWLWFTLPLAFGVRTLFLRDVFGTHLHLKAFGAEQLAQGRIPAFNPRWALGQVYRGNPNALPFYPGNLLYLLVPFFPAFNLHYALHWLIAFLTFRALARELGQRPAAALVAALTYAGSGWMLSCLTFYNILTVSAWWPLVLLGAVRGGRRGIALGGVACGLALLGGEPVTATLGLLPLLWLAIERHGWRRGPLLAMAIGAVGLVIAMPQLVATLRVIGFSFRGAHGLTTSTRGYYALQPVRWLELLMPTPFGEPGHLGRFSFWSRQLVPPMPYVLTLYCGVVALWLTLLAARRHRVWAGLAVVALVGGWLGGLVPHQVSAATLGLMRYPEKLVFWFVLAAALLAGWGLEEVIARPRRAMTAALGLSLACGAGAVAMRWLGPPLFTWLDPLPGTSAIPGFEANHVAGWERSLAIAALLLLAAAFAARRPAVNALLALQLVALLQLFPLVPTDGTAPYRTTAPWAERLGAGSEVVCGTLSSPFRDPPPPRYGAAGMFLEYQRRMAAQDLDYPTGIVQGLSYPLAPDLEGMHTPLFSLLLANLPPLSWPKRLSWLRAVGAQALVLGDDPGVDGLRQLDATDRSGTQVRLFAIEGTAPRAWWPRAVTVADNPLKAFGEVARADDPVATLVVPETVEHRPGGRVEMKLASPDRLEIEVESEGGVLAVRRAYQPLLQASAGGRSLRTLPVDLALLGVEVPAGRQHVVIEASAWPEAIAGAVALAALAAALWLAWRR